MKQLSRLLSCALLWWSCGAGPHPPLGKAPANITPLMDQRLPVDPQVKLGKLDNGLQYLIRANHRPERRAELRLVVKAGSVLEEEGNLRHPVSFRLENPCGVL